jgi:hypothetical protein
MHAVLLADLMLLLMLTRERAPMIPAVECGKGHWQPV